MKRLSAIMISLMLSCTLFAQHRDTLRYPDSYLDTVNVTKAFILNDYFTVGVEYGVSWNNFLFTPAYRTSWSRNPGYYGVFVTHYEKMFGFMPYFGLKAGIAHGTEGFMFKRDPETGSINVMFTPGETGISDAVPIIGETMEVLEAPFMILAHMDTPFIKLTGEAGIYGGYRYNIERFSISDELPTDQFTFKSFEHRFDYGLQGGAGIGLVLEPFEFMVGVRVRYSWSSMYEPDWASRYYYRFAYPFDIMGTAGVYIQLGRRLGKNRAALKKEAYEIVYGGNRE